MMIIKLSLLTKANGGGGEVVVVLSPLRCKKLASSLSLKLSFLLLGPPLGKRPFAASAAAQKYSKCVAFSSPS